MLVSRQMAAACGVSPALGAFALLLLAMGSLCRAEFVEAQAEPSFYELLLNKARLQQRQPKYIIAMARDSFADTPFQEEDDDDDPSHAIASQKETPDDKEDPLKQQVFQNEQTQNSHEDDLILIEKLWHRDHISSPWRAEGLSAHAQFIALLKREDARLQALVGMRQIGRNRDIVDIATKFRNDSHSTEFGDDKANGIQAAVFSGFQHGTSEYYMRMYVGTPSRRNFFLVDIGSDLIWLQCQPCHRCYSQGNIPIFNPEKSSSFQFVSCSSPLCEDPPFARGCNMAGQCDFQFTYADFSYTSGVLAQDTLYMGGYHINNVFFGCSHATVGDHWSRAGSGLVGLGPGHYSLSSQVLRSIFFCLPPWQSTSTQGFVGLGSTSLPSYAIYAKLVYNPPHASAYYISMTGITVNEIPLPVSPSEFALQPDGSGGVSMDTGTTFTRLIPTVFTIFRSAFRASTFNLRPWQENPDEKNVLDTCFHMPEGPNYSNTPAIYFHLEGGVSISLPPENIMVSAGIQDKYCLAFAASPASISGNIFGNFQMAGFLVYIDRSASTVGFVPAQCN